jgi:hypothetical protein
MGKVIRRKTSEIQLQLESKRLRIKFMNNKKAFKIQQTEKKWEELAQKDRKIELLQYEPIRSLIFGAANRWGCKYQNYRLTSDDFLSVFYQVAWKEIMSYTWATDFYLYETLSKAIQSQGRSLLRDSLVTHRRRAFHEALPLLDGFHEFYPDQLLDIENDIIEKIYEEQMLLDPLMTHSERCILHIIYHGGSQREAARQLKTDRRTVSREVVCLQGKLKEYRI